MEFDLINFYIGFYSLGPVNLHVLTKKQTSRHCFLESEQSDFIRRLIVTLDERQQYFTSCVIAVNSFSFFSIFRSIVFTFSFQQRHYRDFISLLPTQISFAILNHLTLKELTIARRVR